MKKHILSAVGLVMALLFSVQVMAQTGLRKGDSAPAFTATDNSGKTVDLKTLLKSHKTVVLFFYRGQWCPYCNRQMQHIQDSLQLLTGKGAYVIGVTPETAENIKATVAKTKASYSIVQDAGYTIMNSYGVKYVMDEATVTKYKGYGLDMSKANGNADNVLPVPATYVIGSNGKILFAHFDKDYSKRASIKDIIAVL
ncbi:peroxiredoxin-like family protein [Mucilaginibacter psychrotolerans]|uniref:thioredoxin-dependent peroxiredoxin n=1 Tax=Mucilaginibacter psychrotolerans TaxID=1524096 RepID=A0A4Y8SCY3_9SPHI|nr:peroxiredoxin-like family protein [Mucilaginibacter psychrotolerans]TFF36531.1 AhpC/TSA family protein [Mucilaginibacter psychrotolerans]